MKDTISDFAGIIENAIADFCERNNLTASSFVFDENTEEESLTLTLNGFDVHFYIGDNLSYGLRLFEDTENLEGYCILTRFKFQFSPFYYSPYDIHNVLDCTDFETLDFHTLHDDDDVKKAIAAVLSFIEKHSEEIGDISGSLLLQKQLKDNYEHDLSVVSKKITPEKLRENFRKYAEKHELNLYFHGRADLTVAFANSDKYKELDEYFRNKSKKNKLTVFEQRLYRHLDENGYKPVSESVKASVKKQVKTNNKNLLIEIPSYIISGILEILTLIVAENLCAKSLPDGLYHIIACSTDSGFSFFVGLLSYKCILTEIMESLFTKKTHASQKHAKSDKLATVILTVICFAVAIGTGAYNYFFNTQTVALHDTGIYVGTKVKNEILPFDSDKLEFFLIEGYSYKDSYDDSPEEKELYIVIDKDYENYIISNDETPGELTHTLKLLKKNRVKVTSLKDYEEFQDTYIYPI